MEIYLHVPYCRQKCRYCDFASFPHAESTQRAYVDAVLTEAASQAAKIPHGAMETAYLGGGTPSILRGKHSDIFEDLHPGLLPLKTAGEGTRRNEGLFQYRCR